MLKSGERQLWDLVSLPKPTSLIRYLSAYPIGTKPTGKE